MLKSNQVIRVNMTHWVRQLSLFLALILPWPALATTLTTTHYRLDPNVTSNFGKIGATTHYGLVDAGGEADLGFGASSSYRLGSGYTAQLQKSIQIAMLPSGLQAYYALDTGVGVQAYDSSINNNTGIFHGGSSWTSGQINGGLALNGTTGYVSTTNAAVNPTIFSLEGWFKTSTNSGGLIMGFGDAQTGASTNLDRVVYLTNSGNLVFGVNPGSRKTITSAGLYNNGSWHHFVATLSPGGMALYADGVSVGTNANASAQTTTGWWRLGYDSLSSWAGAPTSNYLSGNLDEMKIYNRSLSPMEALNEYNAGSAGIVSAQTIPQVTSGISQTSLTDITIRTDGPGYNLAINEDHDLLHTDTVTTIGAVPALVSAPASWNEGITKGLGFTLIAGNQLESKWGTSPNFNYAALPLSSTTFHTRPGYTAASPDATTMQFRLDTSPTQKSGKYSDTVTVSATVIP
jgi:hypothetical protein